MPDRIQLLEQFIAEDPNDPFNYYALGLEYMKKDVNKALDVFKNLVADHADYVATYYQLAKLYEYMGQRTNAVTTYNKGIEISMRQHDLKTLQELRSALEALDEDD